MENNFKHLKLRKSQKSFKELIYEFKVSIKLERPRDQFNTEQESFSESKAEALSAFLNSKLSTKQLLSTLLTHTKTLFNESQQFSSPIDALLFQSPSDLGVQLNGGRSGSKWGPEAIVHQLKKQHATMAKPDHNKDVKINKKQFASFSLQQNVFSDHYYKKLFLLHPLQIFQSLQMQLIDNIFNNQDPPLKRRVHLGGGHDHVLPLLNFLGHKIQSDPNLELVVFNIDAHLDTRVDPIHHSGTPFRNWMDGLSEKQKSQTRLIQVGIEEAANTASNYNVTPREIMEVLSTDQLKAQTQNFQTLGSSIQKRIDKLGPSSIVLLSLDCDGLDAKEMPAVSATNPNGMSFSFLLQLVEALNKKSLHSLALGIYEYNPIYDDISATSAKRLAYLIRQFLK